MLASPGLYLGISFQIYDVDTLGDSGGIRTLVVKKMSGMFYQCATCKSIYLFASQKLQGGVAVA
jgi:hypothetical protein